MQKGKFKCPICGEMKDIKAGVIGKFNNAPVKLCRKCQAHQKKGLKPAQIRKIRAKETK